jgi:ribosomal protein L31
VVLEAMAEKKINDKPKKTGLTREEGDKIYEIISGKTSPFIDHYNLLKMDDFGRTEFKCVSCGNTFNIDLIEHRDKRTGIDICQGCYPNYKPTDKQFKCDVCGLIFVKGITDEEEREEYEKGFGEHVTDETFIVCDDCFKEMVKQYPVEKYIKQQNDLMDYTDDDADRGPRC